MSVRPGNTDPSPFGLRFPPAELIPGLLGASIFVIWALLEGGFEPSILYPGALCFLAVAAISLAAFYRRRLPRTLLIAIALLAAFALWSMLSVLWADAPGEAWFGGNRAILYALVFAAFALPAWRPRNGALLLGGFALALAIVAWVALLRTGHAPDPRVYLTDGRLAEPTGYHNANAALFIGGMLPALILASRRELPWPARGLLLATATSLLQIAMLSQSRGSFLALGVALLMMLALGPGRLRMFVFALPIAVATALAAKPLFDTFATPESVGPLSRAFVRAIDAVTISTVAAFVAGSALALVDRRLELSEGQRRRVSSASAVMAGVATVAVLALVITETGNPVASARDRWEQFKTSGYTASGSVRLGFGGRGRYDFWRVGLDAFSDSPLTGLGADNFGAAYLLNRRTLDQPRFPHSTGVTLLSETGLVGALAFAGFLVAALLAVRLARSHADPLGSAITTIGVTVLAYWFVHSSADWLLAIPAVTAPVFAWLALAAGMQPARQRTAYPARTRSRLRTGLVVGAVFATLALLGASFALPWFSYRSVERAIATWPSDPETSYAYLDQARKLDVLSDRPDLVGGTIAGFRNDRATARGFFRAALKRNPNNWFAHMQLGAIAALNHDDERARRELAAARSLNPGDVALGEVLLAQRLGQPFSLRRINLEYARRTCGLVGKTAETSFCMSGEGGGELFGGGRSLRQINLFYVRVLCNPLNGRPVPPVCARAVARFD